jgi:putative transposase
MPGKNVVKVFVEDSYYHLYNRGWNKTKIFLDKADYQYFEWLLERTLSPKPVNDPKGRQFNWLTESVNLNAYCLMPNHFHMLVHQITADGIVKLMSSVCTSYTMYFNKKYKRRGPLFENTYRGVLIEHNTYLQHISRYIHLNPHSFRTWPYSSYHDYLQSPRSWINTVPILELFSNKADYNSFVLDYEEMQRSLEQIKGTLADTLY